MSRTRRSLLKGTASVAVGLTLSDLGIRPATAAREKLLNLLSWEGYVSDPVVDPFRGPRNATVKGVSIAGANEAINRLRDGETNVWDLICVNGPWARKVLFPERLIAPLERGRFEPYFDRMLPGFKPPYAAATSDDGKELLGLPQRFSPYSFVVNTDRMSRASAEDQGWELFNDPRNAGRYGVLDVDDWNLFGLCLIAGFDPFRRHTDEEVAKLADTARRVFQGAKLIGDGDAMNQALAAGEISFHLSGGTASAAPARFSGHLQIRGITPKRGAMNGKGGLSWVEIASTVNNPELSPLAPQFLEYLQEPASAHLLAFAAGNICPVAQLGNADCLALFGKAERDAIQWDTLEEEMARSAEYDIVPDYDKLLGLVTAAKLAAAPG